MIKFLLLISWVQLGFTTSFIYINENQDVLNITAPYRPIGSLSGNLYIQTDGTKYQITGYANTFGKITWYTIDRYTSGAVYSCSGYFTMDLDMKTVCINVDNGDEISTLKTRWKRN